MHVVGHEQLFGHFAFGIVIAKQHKDLNACGFQQPHLPDEEKPSVEVFPAAVVQVASNHHEVDLFPDGFTHQVFKGVPGGCPEKFGRRILVSRQSCKGAVKMDICCMDKPHVLPDADQKFPY